MKGNKMSFKYLKALPTPEEIEKEYPLSDKLKELKKNRDKEVADIITGEDDRVLLIIGPCSADNEDPVCEYISRLVPVQEKIKDKVLIVPRIYTNKPRTTGEGYKGIASQPDPTKEPDMVEGLVAMRKMHIRAMEESSFTCADEMLYPENWPYVEDLLSYVAIGARSVEDQHHRLTVSGFDVASGMKNPTSGDFSVMLNSVFAAQHPHHFAFAGHEVETTGNPLAHTILRGAVSKHGNSTQNYHYEDLIRLHDVKGMTKMLCVSDTPTPIYPEEEELLRRLGGDDHVIGKSRVYNMGDKIKVIDGPLANMEGVVKWTDRRQHIIGINVRIFGDERMVKLSADYIEKEYQ
mgnify:CR=1 FL=1